MQPLTCTVPRNIMYHFARRNMLCPCCRAGSPQPLSLECIPDHFALDIIERVNAELRRDEQDAIRDDLHFAQTMYTERSHVVPVIALHEVELTVMGYDADEAHSGVQFRFRLYLTEIEDRDTPDTVMTFIMSLHDRRSLSRNIEGDTFARIALAVTARTAGGRVVELARTQPFNAWERSPWASAAGDSRATAIDAEREVVQCIEDAAGAFDVFRPLISNSLHHIRWRTPFVNMLRLIEF